VKVLFGEHEVLNIELADYPELANLPPAGFIALQTRVGWIDVRNLMLQPLA